MGRYCESILIADLLSKVEAELIGAPRAMRKQRRTELQDAIFRDEGPGDSSPTASNRFREALLAAGYSVTKRLMM